ncbi:MAG: TRAP transporter fused permease subunit [Pseudomonadota bacterium]
MSERAEPVAENAGSAPTDGDAGPEVGASDPGRRSFDRTGERLLTLVCIAISLTHLYFAIGGNLAGWIEAVGAVFGLALDLPNLPIPAVLTQNAFHFAGFALLCALLYRPFGAAGRPFLAVDILFGLAVAAAAMHVALAESAIYDRGVKLSTLDWIAGIVVVIGGIELTRRATGIIIPILVVLALSYVTWLGPSIPGVFAFNGLSAETVLFRSLYGDDAMFGGIARISATTVFLFILFGAFLLKSGAGDFVINLARAVAGRLVGGPGLVAVIASGLTGTISGSAVANTASTGVITIPLMRRAGFPAKFAAGVEASSSTGGQLMPPIMGAGAFVMASLTLIPYETIVAVAALPALLYFASVAMFVRIEARRVGLGTMEADGPSLGEAVRRGGASFIIPIGVLITLLVIGFSPTFAAVIGVVAVIVSSWLTEHPMGPRAVVEALALGARNMVMTAVLLCTVGLIVNVIATAGVGNTFSLMISSWAGGNILIAIVLIALASLILGMGLPVTAAYIVLATLSAPALAGMIADAQVATQLAAGTLDPAISAVVLLAAPEAAAALTGGNLDPGAAQTLVAGLPLEIRATLREMMIAPEVMATALLSAHMIVFWLSQDSNVTPPVCLAAFTAAAIAKSPPMATGLVSWKIAKGLYIVPVLFAYTPFLSGDPLAALQIFGFALVGIYGLAAALQGAMEAPLNIALRLVAGAAGIACLWPGMILVNAAGVVVVLGLLLLNLRARTAPTVAPAP